MRILITRSSENQTIGGAELSARDQALALKRLGHTPCVLTNSSRIRQELREHGIATYPSLYLQRFRPPLRYLYFWLLFPLKLLIDLTVVWILHPDIINPHTREDQISYTLTRALHHRPVVWKDPGDMTFVFSRSHGFAGKLYKSLYRYAARRADHIYMLNDEHTSTLVHQLGINTSRLSSIPSSILYEQYHPTPPPDHEGVIFGSLCRLTKEKNVGLLIEAFKELQEDHPDAELRIAGTGPDESHLRTLAGTNPRIKFTGPYDNASSVLNTLDVVVHPALEEGWGRVVKEAMYFGKPVIGSRVGGIKRQVQSGKTGLLFKAGDKKELIAMMRRVAEDPSYRRRLGKNAHNQAIKDGDFMRIVKEMILPIYERLAR